jgi:hypothetical protein
MYANLSPRHINQARAAIAVSVFAISLTGCSEEQQKREYSTPQSLCGTSVDAEELAKFLPAGKEVATRTTTRSPTATHCSLTVDGKPIVYSAQEWWNDMTALEFAKGLTLEKLDHQTDDGRFAYSGDKAFGKTKDCRKSQPKDQVLYTAIQATGSKNEDEAAMKKLITSYTDEVEKSSACR